jgi:hypothetical protein
MSSIHHTRVFEGSNPNLHPLLSLAGCTSTYDLRIETGGCRALWGRFGMYPLGWQRGLVGIALSASEMSP